MQRIAKLAVSLLLLQATTACVANDNLILEIDRLPDSSTPFAIATGLNKSEGIVVRDAQAWADVWRRIHSIRRPKPGLPAVDFEQHTVIVVAQGRKPSGGYAVEITSATLIAGHLQIDITLTHPGKGCIVTTAMVSPVDIAVLPQFDGEAVFHELIVASEC